MLGGYVYPLCPHPLAAHPTHVRCVAFLGARRLERALFSRWMQWLTSNWADKEGEAGFVEAVNAVNLALEKGAGPYFLGAPPSS
jgi:hypothetical protein